MNTVYVTHPRCVEHDLEGHPEHAGRIRAVWQHLESSGLTALLEPRTAQPASMEALKAVHHDDYLALLDRISAMERMVRIDADTYAAPWSYEIARLSAGTVIDAAAAVASGQAKNAMAATRPPGHHAIPARAMGFCLLSNVAIAARHIQAAYGLRRVLIVDYDVHHGNGTEAVFYDDPSVLFISTHQDPLYPGTGDFEDVGTGAGAGTTINIPIPPGHGDESYAAIFDQVIWKAAERYRPEMILVSAGYDAHWTDPLAGMRLSLTGYAHISRELMRMADALCGGKIAFVMEGGYHLETLGYGWANIARLLLGEAEIVDPLGQGNPPRRTPTIQPVIERVKAIHGL
ncbi:MAG: histone deacetylase [bacterium]|nr:histone deacetylase [bacterium]